MAERLDLRGLNCPLPVLRTRKALQGMAPGERLEVECSDPLARIDLPAFLRQSGDVLEGVDQLASSFVVKIQKS